MTLNFSDGQPFVRNSVPYSYQPATPGETTPRIMIEVEIDKIRTLAAVDTGGVYLVCSPSIARSLSLDSKDAISGEKEILFRGSLVRGRLYRLDLKILAEVGHSHTIQATAFVPEESVEGDIPCFLGLYGCIERFRFAVDPTDETFYFG